MNQTVGLRNMSGMGGHGRRLQHGHGGYMSEFGIWYSHPGQGQCNDGHRVGDGSGCTWRAIGIDKAINATCLYVTHIPRLPIGNWRLSWCQQQCRRGG